MYTESLADLPYGEKRGIATPWNFFLNIEHNICLIVYAIIGFINNVPATFKCFLFLFHAISNQKLWWEWFKEKGKKICKNVKKTIFGIEKIMRLNIPFRTFGPFLTFQIYFGFTHSARPSFLLF